MERLSFILSFSYLLIHYFSSSPHLNWTVLSTGATTTKGKKKQIQPLILIPGKSKSYSEQNKEKDPWKLRSWGNRFSYHYYMVPPEGRPWPSPPWGWGSSRRNHRDLFGASSSPGLLLYQVYSHSLMTYWFNSFSWAMALQPLNGKKHRAKKLRRSLGKTENLDIWEEKWFPCGASGKEPACQCRGHKRHRFDPWARTIPWRRAWQPTLVFLPRESPWTEESVWLQSIVSHRVRHDEAT